LEIQEHDEVKKYVDGRYVSASEATWRLFGFDLHNEFPRHQRLAVHLPDNHAVYFHDNDNPNNVTVASKDSTLLAWFKLNQEDPGARNILYGDLPEKYVWQLGQRRWTPRKSAFNCTVGRIYTVSINSNEELYHLRQLLFHIPGAQGYEDLRTVHHVVYSTFKEAAKALGLLDDDQEWIRCMEEAVTYAMPTALRQLFATILIFCNPTDAHSLFERYKDHMTEDYIYTLQQTLSDTTVQRTQDIYDQCLLDIEYSLQLHGKTITAYGPFVLPATAPLLSTYQDEPIVIREQLRLVLEASSNTRTAFSFNDDQQLAFNAIISTVFDDSIGQGKVFFIDGPGGTGKTYLFNSLLQKVRQHGEIALAVASSGTAALLLDGGRTAHSMFKIPLDIHELSTCSFTPRSAAGRLIKMAKLILWDEASMIDRYVFEAVDRSFKDLMRTANPNLSEVAFGGKVMVFGGDFRQVS
jgi:hypothetical protein